MIKDEEERVMSIPPEYLEDPKKLMIMFLDYLEEKLRQREIEKEEEDD